jgi:hypothetical protein
VKRRLSLSEVGCLLPFRATGRRAPPRIPRTSEASLYERLLSNFKQVDERLDRIEAVLDRVLDQEEA